MAAARPDLTLEITRGACLVRVFGKRSRRGWNLFHGGGARADLLAHHPTKATAIQAALDACEPGHTALFNVRPANP